MANTAAWSRTLLVRGTISPSWHTAAATSIAPAPAPATMLATATATTASASAFASSAFAAAAWAVCGPMLSKQAAVGMRVG